MNIMRRAILSITSTVDPLICWNVTFTPFIAHKPSSDLYDTVLRCKINVRSVAEYDTIYHEDSDTEWLKMTVDATNIDFSFLQQPSVIDYMNGRELFSVHSFGNEITSLRGLPESINTLNIQNGKLTDLSHIPKNIRTLNLCGNDKITSFGDGVIEHVQSLSLTMWNPESYEGLDLAIKNCVDVVNICTLPMGNIHYDQYRFFSHDVGDGVMQIPTKLSSLFRLITRLPEKTPSGVADFKPTTIVIPETLNPLLRCKFGDRETAIPVSVLRQTISEARCAGRVGLLKARNALAAYDSLEGIW